MAARIAEIDEQVARLLAEREAIVKSLAFPILQLPVEITSQIFLGCISHNPLDRNVFIPAITLGQVCRHWRAVTLATPELWSSWSLAVGDGFNGQVLESVDLWLSRSQDRPLSIRLYHKDGAGDTAITRAAECWWERMTDFPDAVLPKIIAQRRRWQHIEFHIPLTFLRLLAEVSDGQELPCLTYLSIGSTQDDWGGNDSAANQPITLFAAAPQLRDLQVFLEPGNALRRLEHVQLPCAQLTSFTGTAFNPSECLEVLGQMPALVHGTFHLRAQHGWPTPGMPPPFRHLRSLKLWTMEDSAHPVRVIERLTVPALDTLVLGNERDLVRNLDQELYNLLNRSDGCAIRHFGCGSIHRDALITCLEALPLLETIELSCSQEEVVDFLRNFHYSLTTQTTTDSHWPNIESLLLECCKLRHDGDFPFNALLNVLDALMGFDVPLRRIRLVWISSMCPAPPTLAEARKFEAFVERGIEIYIGTAESSWI